MLPLQCCGCVGPTTTKMPVCVLVVGTHCVSTVSPQWRKGPKNKPMLCNACGIRYLRTRSLTRTSVRGAYSMAHLAAARCHKQTRKPAGAALGKRRTTPQGDTVQATGATLGDSTCDVRATVHYEER